MVGTVASSNTLPATETVASRNTMPATETVAISNTPPTVGILSRLDTCLDLPRISSVGTNERVECPPWMRVSVWASHLAGGNPVVRQQLGELTGPLRRQAGQHIFQVGIGIMAVQSR